MKLKNIVTITGTLTLETGLHIGAGDTEMHIGGIDNAVVKHPFTKIPYIPGSSIKGKIRSLLEWRAGTVGLTTGKVLTPTHLPPSTDLKDNQTSNDYDAKLAKNIIKLFGFAPEAKDNKQTELDKAYGPTRLAFFDLALNTEKTLQNWNNNTEAAGLNFVEGKYENTINRISGTSDSGLRQFERVPAGAVFDFKLNMKILDLGERAEYKDNEADLLETLAIGLTLLQMDSLGGNGSRGYGKTTLNMAIKSRNSSEEENTKLTNDFLAQLAKNPFLNTITAQ